MRRLVTILAVLLTAGAVSAQAPPARGPCRAVDGLDLYNPDRPGMRFTTPPYVALTASGKLRRLARRTRPLRREVALTPEQAACLEALTSAQLTAVRAGASYRYRLQTATGTLLIFHVADLAGGENVVPTQVERLLANAERFLNEGNRIEAARAYLEVLTVRARPVEAATALTALGKMEKEGGRTESALLHFRNAVEAYPRYVPALEEQAALAMATDRHGEARAAYEALAKLVPTRPGPYVALIKLARKREDQQEAARLFRKLQASDRQAALRLANEIPSLANLKTEREFANVVKEIPLRTRASGALLVKVSVNDSEPMTFIVDTGATLVSLREATARRLGIKIDPKLTVMINTAKGLQKSIQITIDRMKIDGVEAKAVEGAILDQDLGGGVEGLLGQSFLRKINARIDVAKKVMVVE